MYSAEDIRRSVGGVNFERGQAYQRRGHAKVVERRPDGTVVTGLVQGTERRPYQVSAKVVRSGPAQTGSGGRALISGDCSCPIGHNCKHVAALMLQAMAVREKARIPVRERAQDKPDDPLSEDVARWLAEIEQAGRSGADEYPPEIRQRLVYVLGIARDAAEIPRFMVTPTAVQLLKSGAFSTSQRRTYDPGTPFNGPQPKFLRPTDMAVLHRLHLSSRSHGYSFAQNGWQLIGEEGAETLARMLATGRCRWLSVDGPVLAEGGAREGRIAWSLGLDGRQRPDLSVAGEGQVGVVVPPWYVDPAGAICGPVATGLPPRVAAALLAAPPLAPAEVAVARSRLATGLGSDVTLPLPSEMAPPRIVTGPPVPRLRLGKRSVEPVAYWYYGDRDRPTGGREVPLATLSFMYETIEVASHETRKRPVSMSNGALVEVRRSARDESAAAKQLEHLGFAGLSSLRLWRPPEDCRHALTLSTQDADDETRWLEFVEQELPKLREAGWQVEIDPDFPYRLASPDGDLEAELSEGSGIDWFELHLGVPIDGERIDILPALLGVLRNVPGDTLAEFLAEDADDGNRLYIRLQDGRTLPLPFGRIRPILAALAGVLDADDDGKPGITLRRADAVDLAALEEGMGVAWRGGEALRALGRRLKDGAGLAEVTPPPSFKGTLRPYQLTGLGWLQLLREVELGGILADDMGLGKTVQVLAHLAVEKAAGRLDRPCLIVAPTSLMPNWQAEAQLFTPDLELLVHHGAERKGAVAEIGASDIVLTTYALLARDIDVLAEQRWQFVIADEAQFVKNPATAAAKAIRRLDAPHRLALTGTPLENNLGELWSLFDFVSPGFLGDGKSFAKKWRGPIEKRGDRERQLQLARRVKPFLLRRTKAEVATDLPPKTEIVEPIALGSAQRELYEGIRLAMHKKLRAAIAAKGLLRSRIEFLDALLKLRQACCDPRLVKTAKRAKADPGSAKLERLMEMLPELVAEGRRILVFSQFTSMLDLIQAELERAEISFVRLDGQTQDRATPVKRFQRGEVPLFLISLKAGGTGLNLTAADTVIHYDPWWNPAVEAQATDRAHRIGQDKPVFVHKLMALDTIEAKMGELKARKQSLADGLFDPEAGGALDISEADVELLLGDGL